MKVVSEISHYQMISLEPKQKEEKHETSTKTRNTRNGYKHFKKI